MLLPEDGLAPRSCEATRHTCLVRHTRMRSRATLSNHRCSTRAVLTIATTAPPPLLSTSSAIDEHCVLVHACFATLKENIAVGNRVKCVASVVLPASRAT